jgi:molybdate transport system substrate-binding protein
MTRFGQSLRRSRHVPRVWLIPMMTWWIVGCGNPAVSLTPGKDALAQPSPAPLRIAAASDLQAALPKLGDRFQARRGIAITPTFLSSGVLAQQIKQGAPYDIFLAANEAFVRDLAGAGLIRPESVHAYARGSLVLAVHAAPDVRVRSLADLAGLGVKKVALANPETAPYGRAGKQALERAGLWENVRSKIVVAESVRQALLYAQNGDAEAALVGRAIASVPEVRTVEIDPGLYDPIVQAMGIIADSPRRADAEAFIEFVLEQEGQAMLKSFGFQPPTTVADAPGNEPRRREEATKKVGVQAEGVP